MAAAGVGAFGDAGVLPGGGIFPGADIGKGLNFDFATNGNLGAGAGLGGLGLGSPFLGGLGGYGVPYIPATPLGSYWGFKGDLIGPILVVGFVLFLIIVVVLAIKAAFAWKVNLLSAKGGKGNLFVRAAADNIEQEGAHQPEENQLNDLAHMVLTAIQSQSCAQKVVCDIGTYARTRDGLANLLRILEAMVPKSMIEPLAILRDSAEGKYDCAQKYPCGNASQKPDDPKTNTVDTSNQKNQNQG